MVKAWGYVKEQLAWDQLRSDQWMYGNYVDKWMLENNPSFIPCFSFCFSAISSSHRKAFVVFYPIFLPFLLHNCCHHSFTCFPHILMSISRPRNHSSLGWLFVCLHQPQWNGPILSPWGRFYLLPNPTIEWTPMAKQWARGNDGSEVGGSDQICFHSDPNQFCKMAHQRNFNDNCWPNFLHHTIYVIKSI